MNTPFTLPRVSGLTALTDAGAKPHRLFINFWDQFAGLIERAISMLQDEEATLAAQQTQLQSVADAISGTSAVNITATANGDKAKASVTLHRRIYLDRPSVIVNGGEVDGLDYSTTYYLYYDDPTRTNTSPTYSADIDPFVASTSYEHINRLYVGVVTTPDTPTSQPTTGGGATPPTVGQPTAKKMFPVNGPEE